MTLNLIRSLEEELFRQSVRASKKAVSALLADDFVEFGRSGGIHDKRDVVDSLAAEDVDAADNLKTGNYRLRQLADGVVLLTYQSERIDDGDVRRTLRSSIWQIIDDRWQMVFHQGTPTDRFL